MRRNERSQVWPHQFIQAWEHQHEHSFAHEQPDQKASLKSPPPSHNHTTITAALAPDPSFSGHIQGRDLVTWEWSHSEFRNTFLKLLQRRILSDWNLTQKKTRTYWFFPALFMSVPTKPHSETWPTDPTMITVNTTGCLWKAQDVHEPQEALQVLQLQRNLLSKLPRWPFCYRSASSKGGIKLQ